MEYLLYFLLAVSLFLIIYVCYHRYRIQKEKETAPDSFTESFQDAKEQKTTKQELFSVPTPEEVRATLYKSSYVNYMTPEDALIHKVKDGEQFIDLFMEAIQKPFSPEQKARLDLLIPSINKATMAYPRLHEIPWKICRVHKRIAQGAPFTMGNIIFLSAPFFKAEPDSQWRTLLHEKVHVFQRKYPHELGLLYRDRWLFHNTVSARSFRQDLPLRGNPDNDELLYGKSQYIFAQVYNSDKPKSIYDSQPMKIHIQTGEMTKLQPQDLGLPTWITQIEHPNEMLAIIISHLLFEEHRKRTTILDEGHPMILSAQGWMNLYL